LNPVLVVGAGWSGAVLARELHDAGIDVHVVERERGVGGHARVERLNGVVYEPNGAHIFHTSNATVAGYVQRFGMHRRYEHRVLTEVFLREDDDESVLLSWPPQIAELKELADWPIIERELADRPAVPSGDDFETYVVSLMGRHLYRLFIEGYTRKQWGCEPSQLASSLAPRRVDLRDDGYTRLFRDTWEFFEAEGPNGIIASIVEPVARTMGASIDITNARDVIGVPSALVVTSPLDDFLGRSGELEWRGIEMDSQYSETSTEDGTITPAYVVNRPSLRVPYTRTVETKHASGQRIKGTVVSHEYPGAPARHYPVPTPDRRYEQVNDSLQREIREIMDGVPVFFCGRLSTYSYIDQDEALACAGEVAAAVEGSRA
jgi:UDP-galactopyranose mutase